MLKLEEACPTYASACNDRSLKRYETVSKALRGAPAIRAVGTEDTTITRLGLQQDAAARALIEILAGVLGHDLDVRVSAVRPRQDGFEN